MTRPLSPLRRAYLIGLRRGFNLAQARMRSKAKNWQAKMDELQDEYELLICELRYARDEQLVQEAVNERSMCPGTLLN